MSIDHDNLKIKIAGKYNIPFEKASKIITILSNEPYELSLTGINSFIDNGLKLTKFSSKVKDILKHNLIDG